LLSGRIFFKQLTETAGNFHLKGADSAFALTWNHVGPVRQDR
jgi:hypothetical protein